MKCVPIEEFNIMLFEDKRCYLFPIALGMHFASDYLTSMKNNLEVKCGLPSYAV